jgi:anti-sigma regulatory factor (Ser/Thr protein kinase)
MGSSASPSSPRRTQRFIARFSSLDDLRDFVGGAAEDFGFSPKAVYQVQMAVDEAFSNIVEHGYEGGSADQVQCSCLFTGAALVVELLDQGAPFTLDPIPEPNIDVPLDEREIGGLGLYFMRKLMDEVHFLVLPGNQGQPRSNLVKMVKYTESTQTENAV